MNGFEEHTGTLDVPKNTGLDGLLLTVKQIIQQHDYVQDINIDSRGTIKFRYFSQNGEEAPKFNVDFDFLQPDSIIRNGQVREIIIPEEASASTIIGVLFEAANRERMYPVAFAAGPGSHFWDWHYTTTGIQLQSRDALYGLPFLTDRHIPDSVLLLCTAIGRGASLVDTQISYKISMGITHQLPPAEVDIIP